MKDDDEDDVNLNPIRSRSTSGDPRNNINIKWIHIKNLVTRSRDCLAYKLSGLFDSRVITWKKINKSLNFDMRWSPILFITGKTKLLSWGFFKHGLLLINWIFKNDFWDRIRNIILKRNRIYVVCSNFATIKLNKCRICVNFRPEVLSDGNVVSWNYM